MQLSFDPECHIKKRKSSFIPFQKKLFMLLEDKFRAFFVECIELRYATGKTECSKESDIPQQLLRHEYSFNMFQSFTQFHINLVLPSASLAVPAR